MVPETTIFACPDFGFLINPWFSLSHIQAFGLIVPRTITYLRPSRVPQLLPIPWSVRHACELLYGIYLGSKVARCITCVNTLSVPLVKLQHSVIGIRE